MRIFFELFGGQAHETLLDLERRLAFRQAGTVGHPEDVRIHGDGRLAKGRIQHHVGRLASDPGKRFQRLARCGHFTVIFINKNITGLDNVFCLAVIQTDGFNM